MSKRKQHHPADDHDLKRAFTDLRESDLRTAPDFGRVLERPASTVPGVFRPRPWLLAAAAAAVASTSGRDRDDQDEHYQDEH